MSRNVVSLGPQGFHIPVLCFRESAQSHVRFPCKTNRANQSERMALCNDSLCNSVTSPCLCPMKFQMLWQVPSSIISLDSLKVIITPFYTWENLCLEKWRELAKMKYLVSGKAFDFQPRNIWLPSISPLSPFLFLFGLKISFFFLMHNHLFFFIHIDSSF